MTLEERINNLEDMVRMLSTQLRVAREDIILLEEGIVAEIQRLENVVFPDGFEPSAGNP